LIKVGLARLKAAIGHGRPGRVLEDLIGNIEKHLERGYEVNPNDTYLAASEADLLELLQESDEAIAALKEGWDANPGDRYIASRLARAYEAKDRLEEASTVVDTALKHRRSDRHLNYRKGMLLRKQGETDAELLNYYFRRSFTPGDDNYEAQFWYARYCYEQGGRDLRREAKGIFRRLRSAAIPFEARTHIRDVSTRGGKITEFGGRVVRMESSHGFVEVDGDEDWLFIHKKDVDESVWEKLRAGSRVTFCRGFTMNGPVAHEVRIQA
jgi:tetratricopeptide (TPR) repeat protein